MNYFYEPVNLIQWNMFEKVQREGHIEPFLATKAMHCGDLVLLHVGKQVPEYESGIYAVGEIITEPYILTNSPEDYCNGKNTVDVKIIKMQRNVPYIRHDVCVEFIHQFRTVHRIRPQYYPTIEKLLR